MVSVRWMTKPRRSYRRIAAALSASTNNMPVGDADAGEVIESGQREVASEAESVEVGIDGDDVDLAEHRPGLSRGPWSSRIRPAGRRRSWIRKPCGSNHGSRHPRPGRVGGPAALLGVPREARALFTSTQSSMSRSGSNGAGLEIERRCQSASRGRIWCNCRSTDIRRARAASVVVVRRRALHQPVQLAAVVRRRRRRPMRVAAAVPSEPTWSALVVGSDRLDASTSVPDAMWPGRRRSARCGHRATRAVIGSPERHRRAGRSMN